MTSFSNNCRLYKLQNHMQMVAILDFTSFWRFDIIFCQMRDNHASVKQVMPI